VTVGVSEDGGESFEISVNVGEDKGAHARRFELGPEATG
jgi:hypothetical protein